MLLNKYIKCNNEYERNMSKSEDFRPKIILPVTYDTNATTDMTSEEIALEKSKLTGKHN